MGQTLGDRRTKSKTVIVVDDEQDHVDVTVLLLESAGHSAYGATDGLAGLKLAIEMKADVLVLDFAMPVMNGAGVGKMFREDPATRQTKILMYSSTSEVWIRSSFSDYDGYLSKAAHPMEMLQAVGRL